MYVGFHKLKPQSSLNTPILKTVDLSAARSTLLTETLTGTLVGLKWLFT